MDILWDYDRRAPFRISLLLGLLLLHLPVSLFATGDDWVLVKRYQSQLALAKQGNAQAMYEIGRMFERGRGVDQDDANAAVWFSNAAAKGHAGAKGRLGILYNDGRGVAKQPNKAYKLLSQAASTGIPSAQFYLAQLYEYGQGTPRNSAKAMKWYQAAAKGGYYKARERVAHLRNNQAAPASAGAKTATTAGHPAARRSPTTPLVRALLRGGWMRNGEPVAYLPSNITTCKKQAGNSINCTSGEQHRSTGYDVIYFNTKATIGNFTSSDQFSIRYTNKVTKSEKIARSEAFDDEEDEAEEAEEASADETGNEYASINTGTQSKTHTLKCELENLKTITCSKGKLYVLQFSR